MKLAFLSPMPPTSTGVSDYSAALLPELSRLAQVDLYSDSPKAAGSAPARPVGEFGREQSRYDAVIYQLGNSPEHGSIYDALRRRPGILVLHDGSLHHFFVDRTLHRGNPPGYLAEMAYAHGAAGYDAALQVVRGAGLYPFYRFPLIRRAADNSLGVIVHSRTVAGAVRKARADVPIRQVDHFAFPATLPSRDRQSYLDALGWPQDAFVVASFGQVSYGKRAEIVLEAFARFGAREPRARLLWVGDLSPEYDLKPLVARRGLGKRVRLTGRVAHSALADYLALCDVAVNLRYPTTGEASGGVMRLLAYGKPTLVSQVGWFGELPEEVVLPVPVGLNEIETMVALLERLCADNAYYAGVSRAAQACAAARPPARAAREYVEFAQEIAEGRYARAA